MSSNLRLCHLCGWFIELIDRPCLYIFHHACVIHVLWVHELRCLTSHYVTGYSQHIIVETRMFFRYGERLCFALIWRTGKIIPFCECSLYDSRSVYQNGWETLYSVHWNRLFYLSHTNRIWFVYICYSKVVMMMIMMHFFPCHLFTKNPVHC